MLSRQNVERLSQQWTCGQRRGAEGETIGATTRDYLGESRSRNLAAGVQRESGDGPRSKSP